MAAKSLPKRKQTISEKDFTTLLKRFLDKGSTLKGMRGISDETMDERGVKMKRWEARQPATAAAAAARPLSPALLLPLLPSALERVWLIDAPLSVTLEILKREVARRERQLGEE